METIKIYNLDKTHWPLIVEEYETAEGCHGFAIFTQNNLKVEFDDGSYGYDTAFASKKDAQYTCDFLNKIIEPRDI